MLSRSNTNKEHTPAQVKKQQSITGKAGKMRKSKSRRNPVQRAASRLYRAVGDPSTTMGRDRECVGPEFVVKSTLPSKQYTVTDAKGNAKKTVTVILLSGQKVDVVCNPNVMTAGQLFEVGQIKFGQSLYIYIHKKKTSKYKERVIIYNVCLYNLKI